MAVANIEELCKGLCELAGVDAPDLVPDAENRVTIALELQDVKFIVEHAPRHRDDGLLIRAVLGPQAAGQTLEACSALLALNCQLHCLGYAFGRNPVTGEIVLDHETGFDQTSPVEMYQCIVSMAQGIHGWREHGFVAGGVQAAA